ncbi:unnamed protein product [Soboliphyme baturini]|uniref:WD_REPEATS_REGION domain-containing protein n=1 Tax=Soboliphyme baturini TaxID=241478 RepID=A0A183IXF8_9BILA|nr:unnamed protein product [Soboliphyme baturini]
MKSHSISRNLVERLAKRQYGSPHTSSFTRAEKCYVNNQLFPVLKTRVDRNRSKVFCSQYINDGDMLISACQDGRIILYKCRNFGYRRFRVEQALDVGWSVLDVAVKPLAAIVHQFRIDVNDGHQQAFRLHPREYHFCIFSMRFNHSGNEILAGGSDRCLYIYDLARNYQALQVVAHRDDVNSVAYADMSSQIFYTGSDDGLCKVRSIKVLLQISVYL